MKATFAVIHLHFIHKYILIKITPNFIFLISSCFGSLYLSFTMETAYLKRVIPLQEMVAFKVCDFATLCLQHMTDMQGNR